MVVLQMVLDFVSRFQEWFKLMCCLCCLVGFLQFSFPKHLPSDGINCCQMQLKHVGMVEVQRKNMHYHWGATKTINKI